MFSHFLWSSGAPRLYIINSRHLVALVLSLSRISRQHAPPPPPPSYSNTSLLFLLPPPFPGRHLVCQLRNSPNNGLPKKSKALPPGDSLNPPLWNIVPIKLSFSPSSLSQTVSIPAPRQMLGPLKKEPSTKLEDQEQQWTAQAPGLRIPLAEFLKSHSPYIYIYYIKPL